MLFGALVQYATVGFVSVTALCATPNLAGLGSGQPQGLGVAHNAGPCVSMEFVSGHRYVSL